MILVSGGAGYIGSHFVKRYLSENDTPILVVDNLDEGHQEALNFSSKITFLKENVGDVQAVKRIISRHSVDTVIHFAASCYVGESQLNPIKYYQNNVINSINLFAAMEESGVRNIVFSSSCATYGNPKYTPMDESHPQEPINVYGLTKLMVEKTLTSLAERLGWSCVALRYFNVAGADEAGAIGESHDPEPHIIPLALKVASGKQSVLEIYGDDYETPDGTCIRDYVDVNDLADAHRLAIDYLQSHPAKFTAINIGTKYGASVKEVVEICRSVTGNPIPSKISPRRPGDPPVLLANYGKARQDLNWEPKRDLRASIENAWKWEQNRRY